MRKTFIPLFVGLLCWTASAALFAQTQVTSDKTGTELQAAIDAAEPGTTVYVQAGTYQGNFKFKDGVNVSGGWNEGFTSQTDYATILDANKSGRPVTSASLTKPTVWSNFKLTNGNPGDGGGGAQIRFNARLDHCLIEGNTTGGSNKGGGGVHLFNGGQLYNCIIRNDTATGDAGGVRISQYNYTGALDCKVINCVIANNTATNRCGGIQAEVDADIIGNTIVGNNQKTDESNKESCCGLNCAKSSNVSSGYYLANNIIWGNKHKGTVNSAQIYYISRYPATQRANNAVYNQDTGTGSINLSADDPGFVNKAKGDYSLDYTSSLRNAGSNNFYTEGDKDLNDYARKIDGTVDIGAYECQFIAGDRTVSVGEDLQYVVNFTLPGQKVKVQEGTFTGNFVMINNVDVEGGYNAGFSAVVGKTTLDANHSGRVLTQHAGFATETTWSNFILQNGNASGDGGGAQLHHNGVLSNCVITNNTASGNAGGVIMENGGKVLNSKIISNKAGVDAGGVRMKGDTNPGTLANCLVANDTAEAKTGGISLESREQYVYNNTIVNNNQTSPENASRCGVRLNVSAALEFANNIIWGNTANGVEQADQIELNTNYKNNRASYFLNNAIVLSTEFATETTKTIYLTKDKDPFIKAADDTYYLNIATAADLINSGENSKAQGPTDLDGNPRKQGTIDRGCYEQTMYSRTVTEGNYGTICLPFAVEEGSFNGAKIYKVVSFADELQRGIVLEEVDAMEAGKPYFFLGEASTVKFRYVRAGDEAAAGNENGLYGTISGTTVSGQGKYVLQNNELRQTYNEATSSDIEINLDKNRAYLVFSEIPDAPAVAPVLSPRRRVIGVHQTPTGMETITNDQYTNKVIKDGRLIIIRDGKMYNALGQQL